MLRVRKLQQHTVLKLIQCFTLQRRQTSLHHAVGAVQWMSRNRPAPLLTAAPVRAIVDEPISIKGQFLPPYSPVTLCARLYCEDGDLWEASAHYNTKADGTVNLTRDHSVGGSYLGCEPMGLFWALRPSPGEREGPRLRKKNVETPYVVHISLWDGHVSPSERPSTELAAVTAERWFMAPGVRRIEIRQNGIVGTLFLPPGPGPFPAMLDLWGVGGGLPEYRSALFASRGYASLSLAYMKHKDLPGPFHCLTVGDSYFKSAFQLLQEHHQVCADRVGIIGLSYGVYLTLRIATQFGVKPSCLICVNGPAVNIMKHSGGDSRTQDSDSDPQYWTYDHQGYVTFKEVSSLHNICPGSRLKLENITCPLMYILGEDDLNTSSVESVNLIEETLRAAGKSHLFTCLSYPGAGHLIEPPYTPLARTSQWRVKPIKMMVAWGGHVSPHAAAQEDAWRNIQEFMENNLRQ
ncbi:bile acid-CoA:amino acid N-acyltransferase-like [Solea solea]|uniref:bile acid-CoA:amino acid N-acyltransferase-like n=1 Tax=Solea solea TaxID=90069 RepID=UPI00272B7E63|nr:bile acid-CoA:amino acid N-acyltransferase-like [Solea solea]